MTKTIAQLWRGEIEPIAYSGAKNDEIKQLVKQEIKNAEKLKNLLSEKEMSVFESYSECTNKCACAMMEQAFCDGFALGTKITAEAFVGAEEVR